MTTERSLRSSECVQTAHQPRPIINEFTGEALAYDATAPREGEQIDASERTIYLSGAELLAALERASHDDANV